MLRRSESTLRLSITLKFADSKSNSLRTWTVVAFSLVVASLLACLAVQHGFVAVLLAGLLSTGLFVVSFPSKLQPMFQLTLAFAILGYVFLGKSFAYLGISPLFVGELILVFGMVSAIISFRLRQLTALSWLVAALSLLSVVRTMPSLEAYGLSAVRDLALLYYPLFSLLVFWLVTVRGVRYFLRICYLALPFLAWWLVVSGMIDTFDVLEIPTVPGSDISWLTVKNADRGVWLGVIGAFALLRVYEPADGYSRIWRLTFWMGWLGGFFWVAATTRGGLLAILAALSVCLLAVSPRVWIKPLVVAGLIATMLVVLNPTIPLSGDRDFSVQSVVSSFTSIFFSDPNASSSLQGTRNFRLTFWGDVYRSVVEGRSKLFGLGFGVNLPEKFGYYSEADQGLRNAHNSHLTVLARVGTVGFLLWTLIHIVFATSILRFIRREHFAISSTPKSGHLATWVLSIWMAVIVNTTFDPFLDGPQGAIPFWAAFGLGLIVLDRRTDLGELWGGSKTGGSTCQNS